MGRGPLYQIAVRQASSLLTSMIVVTLLCAGVLALNYQFFYNWSVGPVPFTTALAERPGQQRWAEAKGPVLPTGLTNVRKRRGISGLLRGDRVTGYYSAMLVDGKLLIVKTRAELSGSPVVQGRLETLPSEVREALGADGATSKLHGWMLNGDRGYGFWDGNLFVLVFTPAFPLCLLALGMIARLRLQPQRGELFVSLKRYGDPSAVAGLIDHELRSQGVDGQTGELFLTRSWLIGLSGGVVKLGDLVGLGASPASATMWQVTGWRRGDDASSSVTIPAAEARPILDRLHKLRPSALVDDVKAFEARWKLDRAGCEAEADAALAAAAAAAAANVVPPLPAKTA